MTKLISEGSALQINNIPAKNPIGMRNDFLNFMLAPLIYTAENSIFPVISQVHQELEFTCPLTKK